MQCISQTWTEIKSLCQKQKYKPFHSLSISYSETSSCVSSHLVSKRRPFSRVSRSGEPRARMRLEFWSESVASGSKMGLFRGFFLRIFFFNSCLCFGATIVAQSN